MKASTGRNKSGNDLNTNNKSTRYYWKSGSVIQCHEIVAQCTVSVKIWNGFSWIIHKRKELETVLLRFRNNFWIICCFLGPFLLYWKHPIWDFIESIRLIIVWFESTHNQWREFKTVSSKYQIHVMDSLE